MKSRFAFAIITATAMTHAWADKYGVDDAMGESGATVQEMVWGALIVGVAYWLWKKFFR